ncbi:hypothetical protein GOL95_31565 [Sinorhizobium medicae]|nr:hypothetical protein [Sinorhizobium medicae]MDX1244409.1 hypothetical protein [Sinorhizobium medicae]
MLISGSVVAAIRRLILIAALYRTMRVRLRISLHDALQWVIGSDLQPVTVRKTVVAECLVYMAPNQLGPLPNFCRCRFSAIIAAFSALLSGSPEQIVLINGLISRIIVVDTWEKCCGKNEDRTLPSRIALDNRRFQRLAPKLR